jgi:hypothetical protein
MLTSAALSSTRTLKCFGKRTKEGLMVSESDDREEKVSATVQRQHPY